MDKIEPIFCDNIVPNIAIMNNPIYSINDEFMCGTITHGNKTYLVDLFEKDRILNFHKKFVFADSDDIYPSYAYNYRRISYINFIFRFKDGDPHFINNNIYDLRRNNVVIYHCHHKYMLENYDIIEYIQGHYVEAGPDAYIIKNPLWKIRENDKEILFMYCEKNTICKLCDESYNKILQYTTDNTTSTFYKHTSGYIMCNTGIYIHQIITGCYGNGKGTKNVSVDHIDRNPLNNTMANLRIATRQEQEQNCKGIAFGTTRARSSKKIMPPEITEDMLRKYVYYNHEFYDADKTKSREFFRVEHPKLDKNWCSSKSSVVSIIEKLQQSNKIVSDLDNNIYPDVESTKQVPKYVSRVIIRDRDHLVFEKRTQDKRLNVKMVLPKDGYDLQEQLCRLNVKIQNKYEGEDNIV